jgi:uncharacterized membrane protein YedE/YeeE
MNHFTPFAALAGGLLIGIASAAFLLLDGRVAGISGMVAGLFEPPGEDPSGGYGVRAWFVAGLVGGGAVLALALPASFEAIDSSPSTVLRFALAGLIVGIGSRLGNGCTSGHGVCGLSLRSVRSLAATMTFMAAAIAVVFVRLHLAGGVR